MLFSNSILYCRLLWWELNPKPGESQLSHNCAVTEGDDWHAAAHCTAVR